MSAQKYSRPDGYAPVHIRQAMVSYVHKQSVDSVCFSPDSTRLATAASNDCVLLWDVAAQQPVRVLERRSLEAMPSQVSFSADGRLLAASVGGGIVQLWNGDGRMVAGLPGHDPGPTEAVFSPKGTLLASGDLTGRVRLWDVESRQVLCSFLGATHDRPKGSLPREWRVDYFTFAPDGMRLAFDSPDIRGRVQVWDLQDPGPEVVWRGSLLKSDQFIWTQAFSPDGHFLAISDFDQDVVHLFDARSLAQEGILQIPNDFAKAIAFSPDGRFLATGGAAGMVWIWEVAQRQIVASFAAHTEGPDYRKNAQEWALGDMDWSSDGRYLVTCGRDPYTVKLWDVQITG